MNKTYNNLFELLEESAGIPQKLFRILDNRFTEIWTQNIKIKAKTKTLPRNIPDIELHLLADAQVHRKIQYKISEEAFLDSKKEWTELVHSIGGEFFEFKYQLDNQIFSIDPCSVIQKNSREIEHPSWIAIKKETALKIVALGYLP